MALRAVTTALDSLTLTEWRNTLATWFGVAYADLDSDVQTELNRLIDEAHDWVSKIYGHERWSRRVWTVGGSDFTAPSTSTGLFDLPADCRQIISIQESEDGTGAEGKFTNYESWMQAGAGTTAHPWDNQSAPYYFFKAMSDANPPVETWQRVPTPATAATAMTILGRPYFTLLGTTGDTQYTELPPQVVPELRHHLRAQWFAFRMEYEKVGIEIQLRDDAVRATQVNSAPSGAEVGIATRPSAVFDDEMSGP
jgi:hypothetical protein